MALVFMALVFMALVIMALVIMVLVVHARLNMYESRKLPGNTPTAIPALRYRYGITLLLGLLMGPPMAVGQPRHPWRVDKPTRCVGNYHSEADAILQLERLRATFDSPADWKGRVEKTRAQLLEQSGLSPLPARTPLKAIRHSPRQFDRYIVESIAFEPVPGFFAYGSLYRPEAMAKSRQAAILSVHGHWDHPNGGGRFRPDNQVRCATLARMGAVVLAVDMIGFGESARQGWQHRSDHTMPLQLWTNIRAIDYLVSLPNIDENRLGVTGASGGGTQTIQLALADERIDASVPVCMVSAHFFGGCVCESGHPIHLTPDHETNNVDIAAGFAPKPQLLISVGGDWTKNTPEVEYPYVRDIYRLLGEEQYVENAHFADEDHDYGPSKRRALYAFLAQHLQLSKDAIDETRVTIETTDQMVVFNAQHPIPDHALPANSWPGLPKRADNLR